MQIKLIEELQRNKELMGLNEYLPPNHISVSEDGKVIFWDLKDKKVYLIVKIRKKVLHLFINIFYLFMSI